MGGKSKKKSGGKKSFDQQQQQGGRGGERNYSNYSGGTVSLPSPPPAAAAAATPSSPTPITMECNVCSEKYDQGNHKPRNLQCGHSFCTSCCERLLVGRRIMCPQCRHNTWLDESTCPELPINYPVLELLKSPDSDDTPSTRSWNKEYEPQYRQDPSPHGGRCLEAEAPIEVYCSYCNKWLCKDCSRIDHTRQECRLKPYKDALRNMHQGAQKKAWQTANFLKKYTHEANAYNMKLKSFVAFMELALECVNKEQQNLLDLKGHGLKMEREIIDVTRKPLPSSIEEALFFINGIEDSSSVSQKWGENASASLKGDQVFKLSKSLLNTAIQMHMDHNTQQNSGWVVALHNINGKDAVLPMEMDRGRLLVNAASNHSSVPTKDCKVLKLDHVKSCIDPSRALTFLDISLKGQKQGRVFIRLLDSTKRSRCFLLMCTGETGPSFIGTPFHRFWWPNKPGEHVWGGDFTKGNGSGGVIPIGILHEINELQENRSKVPITPGLIAGRPEKSISTIFRIYTKKCDEMEEAAFGRVEFGFNVFKDAVENTNCITDITISGCGVVVEP